MNLETEIQRELWQAVRHSYESSSWSNAILDAVYCLSDAIRAKTGLQSDGTALAGQAFGGKTPKLRLNRLETESEQSIQQGVEQLLRGLYQAIRNPRSHGRLDDTQTDADAIIILVNFLMRVIGHARAEFSLDACVQRVLEENFVPNDRYARLLVNEIPLRQRLQVVLTVYQNKARGDGEKLGYFFAAILPELSEADRAEFFRGVSSELRETTDDGVIRTVFQFLDAANWLEIDEIARIRVEHRVIRNLEDGRFEAKRKRCNGGAFATWAKGFFVHFSLKEEAMNVLVSKLRSSSCDEQDYVFNFFFSELDSLAPKPTPGLVFTILNGLKAGDERFLNAVITSCIWSDELWGEKIQKAIEEFEVRSATPDDDEDVPF